MGKQSLKLVPVVGWCWIFTESIFLRRIWESDRETLVNDLRKVLDNYPENYYFNVKIFLNFLINYLICLNSNLVFTFL